MRIFRHRHQRENSVHAALERLAHRVSHMEETMALNFEKLNAAVVRDTEVTDRVLAVVTSGSDPGAQQTIDAAAAAVDANSDRVEAALGPTGATGATGPTG